MSWDGMLPQQPCKDCGKMLNADGGHPAETYAGTFTGLCYTCTAKAPYIVETFPDGGHQVSHPPEHPSYRRDRTTYTWYEGCATCHMGRMIVFRENRHGGSYAIYCPSCSARHSAFQEAERERKLCEDTPLTRLRLRFLQEQAEQLALVGKRLSKKWTKDDRELAQLRLSDYDGLLGKLEAAIELDAADLLLRSLEATYTHLTEKELSPHFRAEERLPWLKQGIELVRAAIKE